MSRLMNAEQHNQLMLLRGNMAAAVLRNETYITERCIGMVQGYLLGLYAANEIDFGDVQSLEAEVMQGINFLVNARKAGHAS